MFALERGPAAEMLTALGQRLPRPRAILVASAHWDTAAPAVSTVPQPPTIHDFYGFPPALYELGYAPPGAVDLAHQVASLLRAAEVPCSEHPQRGLDHGAWVPLMFMYPQADIPVTQISIQTRYGSQAAYGVGRLLAPLAEQGVLLMGSGSITHNFQELDASAPPGASRPWVDEFVDWIADRVAANDTTALLDYRRQSRHGARAHPAEDHMVPLHFALGAAGCAGERLRGGMTLGTLSMDSFLFTGEPS
jgi:4,5-DOPA dioxygenase extradiol